MWGHVGRELIFLGVTQSKDTGHGLVYVRLRLVRDTVLPALPTCPFLKAAMHSNCVKWTDQHSWLGVQAG